MGKRRIRVVSAGIDRDGCYLITQRNQHAVFPLLWEFPGGRVGDDEVDEAALLRTLKKRLGISCNIGELISFNEREYDDYIVELYLYAADIGDAQPQANYVNAFAWVSISDFDRYEFTPADQDSMDALLQE